MIFVTVGTQGPFDRLVAAADSVAAQLGCEALFQINSGMFHPVSGPFVSSMGSLEFDEAVKRSTLVIAHAGMGSIITALEYARPVVVMPRLARLGEHRNDHQTDTAKTLESLGMISVCWDQQTLGDIVRRSIASNGESAGGRSAASTALPEFIAHFVREALIC